MPKGVYHKLHNQMQIPVPIPMTIPLTDDESTVEDKEVGVQYMTLTESMAQPLHMRTSLPRYNVVRLAGHLDKCNNNPMSLLGAAVVDAVSLRPLLGETRGLDV